MSETPLRVHLTPPLLAAVLVLAPPALAQAPVDGGNQAAASPTLSDLGRSLRNYFSEEELSLLFQYMRDSVLAAFKDEEVSLPPDLAFKLEVLLARMKREGGHYMDNLIRQLERDLERNLKQKLKERMATPPAPVQTYTPPAIFALPMPPQAYPNPPGYAPPAPASAAPPASAAGMAQVPPAAAPVPVAPPLVPPAQTYQLPQWPFQLLQQLLQPPLPQPYP